MHQKLAVINGLRGVAILGVIFTHLFGGRLPEGTWMFWIGGVPVFPLTFLTNARDAVALFFFLSGFVLFLPYVRGDRQMRTWKDARDFIVRRARRLLPLHMLALLVGITLLAPQNVTQPLIAISTMTFVFSPEHFNPAVNPALWTIGVEWWASMLMPAAIISVRRFGMGKTLSAVVIVCFLVRLYGMTWGGFSTVIFNGPFGRFDDFAWGMAAAWIYARHRGRMRAWWFWPGLLCAGLGLWIRSAQVYMLESPAPFIWQFTTIFLGLGCFLMTAGLLARERGTLHLLFANPPLQAAGLMCYSLYVWHYMMIGTLDPLRSPAFLLRYGLILAALSLLTYRYVEFGHEKDLKRLLPTLVN